jgi:hypothetical protein
MKVKLARCVTATRTSWCRQLPPPDIFRRPFPPEDVRFWPVAALLL